MAPTRRLAELFYDLRAKTEGLDKDLQGAERSFGKFTNYVLKNPVLAIGAVGTALLGVAIKAARMAEDVEKGMRRVQIATTAGAAEIKVLRAQIEGMSVATGRTQAELAKAAALAAKSAGSTEEIAQRLQAALDVSQATGEDLEHILEAVDDVLDTFGLSSDKAAESLATLFSAARGRESIVTLFEDIEVGAHAINTLGLDLDTAARAIVVLGERGLHGRALRMELDHMAESGAAGRREIEKLAASIPPGADAMGDLQKAAKEAAKDSASLSAILRADFARVMIDLGERILPLVNFSLRGLIQLMDLLTGRTATAAAEGPLATVITLGPLVEKLEEQGKKGAKGIRDLKVELNDLIQALRSNDLKLADLPVDRLKALQSALESITASGRISATQKTFVTPILAALDDLIAKAPKAAEAVATVSRGGLPSHMLAEQEAARKAAAKAAESAAKEAQRIRERQLQDELDAVHRALDAQVDARKKANERIFEAQRDAAKKLAEMAGDTVGVLKTELEETVEQFKALGASDAELDRITKPLQVAVTSATALNGALERIEIPSGLREKLADPLAAAKKEAEEYADAMEAARAATLKVANAIANIGQAVLSVASAMGLVSQRTEDLARGAIGIGQGIASGNALQVAAGVGDLISGITAGNRERAAQHREALERLEAIKKHTGDLVGRDVTGNQLNRAGAGVGAVLGSGVLRDISPSLLKNLNAELARLGLSFEDMQQIAAEFGVTLGVSEQSWQDFKAVLDAVDLKAFTDSFDGMLDAAAAARRIFGTQNPLKELEDTARILAKFSPEFANIFAGLDLTQAGDRATALERVMAAFEKAIAGGADLGDLTLSEFIDGLGDVGDLIRELAPDLDALSPAFSEAVNRLKKFQAAVEQFNLTFERLDLAQRFGGLSADDVLTSLVQAFGENFKDAASQIDFSTLEGFKETAAALIDSFFADGELTDQEREQIRVLEVLLGAYEDAAAGALSLADTLSRAFQDIDLDAAIFGESFQDTFNKKFSQIIAGLPTPEGTGGFTPGGGFDLSTQAGRDEARASLQQLAISQPDLKPLIADLIQDLDRLPELVGEEVGAAVGKAVSQGTSISGSIQQLTIFQGDRLITLAESKLLRLTQIRDLIAGSMATRGQVLQPPSDTGAQYGYGGGGGGGGSNNQQGDFYANITVNVPDGVTEPAKIADMTVDRLLADAMVRARFLSGSNRAT